MDIPLVLEKNAFPKYCHFYHEGTISQARTLNLQTYILTIQTLPSQGAIYFKIGSLLLGRVYSSTNNGLPLTELDLREGDRGDVDTHTGEDSTDDLIRRTVVRPAAGTWRFYANIDLLTKESNATLYSYDCYNKI